jgi:hypothetical protein
MDSFRTLFGVDPPPFPMLPPAALERAEAAGRAAQDWMREMSDFLAARLEADAATMRAARSCGTVTDLAVLQQTWLAEAATAYAGVGLRLTETMLRIAVPPDAQDAPASTTEGAPAAAAQEGGAHPPAAEPAQGVRNGEAATPRSGAARGRSTAEGAPVTAPKSAA